MNRDLVLAILSFVFAICLAAYAVAGIRNGKLRTRFGVAVRADTPFRFWRRVLLFLALACFFVVLSAMNASSWLG